jgi:ATP-binding cassette subfamily B protein
MKIVYQNKQAAVSRTTSHIESAFSGIDILKSYTAETDEINRFENEIKKRSFYEIEAVKIEAFFSSFFPNLSFMGQFLIVVLGGNLISTGDISLGEFYAFFNYLTFLFLYGIDIAMFFISGKQAMVSVFRLIEIENHPQEINYNFNDIISGKFVTSIEVKNIFLKNPYNDNEFILNNINFTIPGGTWISIVGPVGAGKSVLLEILAGIIKPDKGDLFFNGKNLKYISRNQISNFRGYVPTEPIIFSCSIKENIELFRKLKYENVEFSSSIAQLINEIQEMPFKFDQKVGDKGMLLSGGQKQRLSIARALAHNPFLLILDDVTSSLDSENENAFFNSLEQKFKGLTCIYATHRLKTAQKSDLIICLKDGEIAGSGTHQHLLKNCSIYIDMIASQSIK